MSAAPPIHLVHPEDDVAIALRPLTAGERLGAVTARQDVPTGHKIAVRDVAAGAPVRKYGWPIGAASHAIAAGDHVHTHNLATQLGDIDAYQFAGPDERRPGGQGPSFMGYRRADGRVGTR